MSRGRPKKSVDVEMVCENCEGIFIVPEWESKGPRRKKYCSKPCYHESRVGRTVERLGPRDTRKCRSCGNEFVVGGRNGKKYTQMFCSRACWASASREHPAPRDMALHERAWLAALVDGEGSIGHTHPSKNQGLRLNVTNTHKGLVNYCQEVTGTGSILQGKRYQDHHKPIWYWTCYGHNAFAVLEQITEYLIAKQDKALEILKEE